MIETATAITFESALIRRKWSLHGCDGAFGGNLDFHRFEVPEDGMTITVHTLFTHDDGDVDIVLYRPDGSRVEAPLAAGIAYDPTIPNAISRGLCTDNETIVYPSTATG